MRATWRRSATPKTSSRRCFDEVTHGEAIVERLDVEHVLGNPETCASLRVLFGWCVQATGGEVGARFCLDTGIHDVVTGPQLAP